MRQGVVTIIGVRLPAGVSLDGLRSGRGWRVGRGGSGVFGNQVAEWARPRAARRPTVKLGYRMDQRETQRLLSEARGAQARARAVLESLVRTRRGSPAQDLLAKATGRSSTDHAIESTRRIIETLERSIGELERRLPEGARVALGASDPEPIVVGTSDRRPVAQA